MQREDESMMNGSYEVSHLVNLWATDAPTRLQGSIKNWIQRDSYKSCNTDRTLNRSQK
jgi:hypothetical protein